MRHGYLPERDVLTAASPVAVKVPKVHNRSGTGVKFHSIVFPLYVRKALRMSAGVVLHHLVCSSLAGIRRSPSLRFLYMAYRAQHVYAQEVR